MKSLEDIWIDAKKNDKKLNSCKLPHKFREIEDGQILKVSGVKHNKSFGKRYVCVKCGGEIDSYAYYWYMKGLKSCEILKNR